MSAVHPVQTIERTSKRWKATQAVGMAVFVLGILLLFGSDEEGQVKLGAVLGILGLTAYLYARIGAWWENG